VISTAGSPSKRAYLRQLGVKHVFDSRSLSFAEDVRRVTKGRGIDIVLNALAGDAIPMAAALLAPNGRFIEIGKRDIFGDSALGLRALRRNGSFFVLDMARMDRDDPEAVKEVFADMLALFERGKLKPLPTHTFPASKMQEAFKTMAQARHIGKVVVDFDAAGLEVDLSTAMPLALAKDGAYLITGGLGGFGAEVARYLAAHGAGHLYLLGRSGADRPEAKALLADLARKGIKAHAIAADVTKRADVDAVLVRIAKDKVKLRGVIHSAMVLDDGFINQLDAERMMRVMAPKIVGAWNLHEATAKLPLDHFVMFSSMAAVLGSSGQANYVAGNRFLDLLAAQRRKLGLPAVTVNWGALGGAGAVQRDKAILKYLKTMGMPPLSLEEALTGLGVALRKSAPAVGCCKVDWQALGRANPAIKQLRRFSDVAADTGAAGGGGKVRNELLAAKGADRLRLLNAYLTQQIARVLKVDAAKIESGRPLNELGLDSLTSFQLKNKVENEIGITLPVGKFLQKPTVESLAATIGEVLETAGTEKSEETRGTTSTAGGRILSARQEWLWHQLRKDGQMPKHGMMEMVGATLMHPGPDIDRLGRAFKAVVARHETLRSHFPDRNGKPAVELLPLQAFKLDLRDATASDDVTFLRELRQLAGTQHDVENGPLINLHLFLRPGERCVMMLRGHHLLMDGWSFATLLRELFEEYFGVGAVAAGKLGEPAEKVSYFDYARWQKSQLSGDAAAADRNFWSQYLLHAPPPIRLGKAASPVPADAPGRSVVRFVAASDAGDVRGRARKMGVSLHALMSAAYQTLLHGVSGATDLVLPVNIANRSEAAYERLVGWMNNVLLVRTEVDPADTFKGQAHRASEAIATALEHGTYPIHLVLEAAKAANGRELQPNLTGIYMVWPDNMERAGFERMLFSPPSVTHRFGDMEVAVLPVQPENVGHFLNDATLFYQEIDGALMLNLHYRQGVFDEQEAGRFIDRFMSILRMALDDPERSVASLAMPS